MKSIENKDYGLHESPKIKATNMEAEITKTKVNNLIISQGLADLFGLNKGQIEKMSGLERLSLSDENELNQDEYELSKIFGKKKQMIDLSLRLKEKEPLTVANVLGHYDVYENLLQAA